MSGSDKLNGMVVGGIVLCCVIGAGAFFALQPKSNGPVFGSQPETVVAITPEQPTTPEPVIEEPAQSDPEPIAEEPQPTPAPTPEPQPTVTPTPEPEPEPEPEVEKAEDSQPAEPEEPVAEDFPPIFDIVRIDRSGSGLVAGRATPDTDIEIVNDGQVVGRTRTGRDGAFVAYVSVDPSIAAQQLIAQATRADAETRVVAAAPVVVVTSPEEDAEPVIFQPSEEGVRLIQPAARPNDADVTLDSISYDAGGRVTFAGRAQQNTVIRLYVDDALVLEARASDDSSWGAAAGDAIAPGVYTLRVDQIDAQGAVTSRLETPFQRERIEEGAIGDNTLTVQTGNNLWKLAEGVYGEGVRYTLIYQANKDTIRDPDLIYPGQIFKLPDAAPSQ